MQRVCVWCGAGVQIRKERPAPRKPFGPTPLLPMDAKSVTTESYQRHRRRLRLCQRYGWRPRLDPF
jgi:hypothetical protein